jgi:hypothetical protein
LQQFIRMLLEFTDCFGRRHPLVQQEIAMRVEGGEEELLDVVLQGQDNIEIVPALRPHLSGRAKG